MDTTTDYHYVRSDSKFCQKALNQKPDTIEGLLSVVNYVDATVAAVSPATVIRGPSGRLHCGSSDHLHSRTNDSQHNNYKTKECLTLPLK